MIKLALLMAVFSLFPRPAQAFPELVRYGYVNCTSCHVSPSGGGVLTEYGRQLSAEALSTWSTEDESAFLYKAVPTPQWLNIGGDLRAVEIYRNTPQVWAFRFLNMQEDLELAGTYDKFTADVSGGLYMGNFESRRYYLNYRPTDEISYRFGKFRQAYGLMEPDHTTPITRGLGWDEDTESYNFEAAWMGANLNVILTANFGPMGSTVIPDEMKEKGLAARVGVPFKENYLVGASYFHGVSETANRDVAGPYAMLGFTHHSFLLSEFDFQSVNPSAMSNSTGWVTWNRLDYEFMQGLHGYLTYQLTRPDFQASATQTSAYGIGSQWFPRPHFEFDLLWQRQSEPAFPDDTLDYVVLLLHYYL